MSNSAQIVIGVILLISAVFLIIAILMQDSKNEGLSSALTGADNTSFGGKTKSKKLSGTLSKVTTIVAICYVLVTTVNRSLPTPEIDNNTTTAATTTPAGEETTSTTETPTEETTPASATPTEETPTPTESVTSSATETPTPTDENA